MKFDGCVACKHGKFDEQFATIPQMQIFPRVFFIIIAPCKLSGSVSGAILNKLYDDRVDPRLMQSSASKTRGHDFKLYKK